VLTEKKLSDDAENNTAITSAGSKNARMAKCALCFRKRRVAQRERHSWQLQRTDGLTHARRHGTARARHVLLLTDCTVLRLLVSTSAG